MLLVPCSIYPQLTPSSLEYRCIGQLSTDNSVSRAFLSHFLFLKAFWGPQAFARNTTWKSEGWELNAPRGQSSINRGWTEWSKCQLLAHSEWFPGCPLHKWALLAHSGNNPLIKHVLYWLFPLPVLFVPLPPVSFPESLPVQTTSIKSPSPGLLLEKPKLRQILKFMCLLLLFLFLITWHSHRKSNNDHGLLMTQNLRATLSRLDKSEDNILNKAVNFPPFH